MHSSIQTKWGLWIALKLRFNLSFAALQDSSVSIGTVVVSVTLSDGATPARMISSTQFIPLPSRTSASVIHADFQRR
jgi:hypothetical protein